MLHDVPSVDLPGDCHPLSSLLFGGLICHVALIAVQVLTRKLHTCSVFWSLYVLPVAMASFRGFPMASSDQNSLRTPLPGYCLVTLADAPASPWLVHSGRCWAQSREILGQAAALSPVWPAQLPPRAAAVSSVAKQEDWTRAQADLKALPVSQRLEFDRSPSSFPKAGLSHPPPAGPVQPVCGVAFREGAPQDMEGSMRVRGRAQVSRSFQSLIPGAVSTETLGKALSFLTLVLVSSWVKGGLVQHLHARHQQTAARHPAWPICQMLVHFPHCPISSNPKEPQHLPCLTCENQASPSASQEPCLYLQLQVLGKVPCFRVVSSS